MQETGKASRSPACCKTRGKRTRTNCRGSENVPVLGALFKSSGYQKNETELVVIVTPRLVQPDTPGQVAASPLDNTVPANDFEFFGTDYAPGGWGAEESGTPSGPGPEATGVYFASQLGACWAELGPYYDLPNEAVIPAVANVAAVPQPGAATMGIGRLPPRFRAVMIGHLPRKRLLPPPPSGAIMKRT